MVFWGPAGEMYHWAITDKATETSNPVRKFQISLFPTYSVLWGLYEALCKWLGRTEMLDNWKLWCWLWDSRLDYLMKLLTCLSSDGYLLMNHWREETNTIIVYWAPGGCLHCNSRSVWTTDCWFGSRKVKSLTTRTNGFLEQLFNILGNIYSHFWQAWDAKIFPYLIVKYETGPST